MHRLDRAEVLIDHRRHCPAAFRDVTLKPADETRIGVGIDEDFDVAEVADARIDEEENAVDDHDVSWWDAYGFVTTGMIHEVVHWLVDRFAAGELRELADEVIPVECVWVIPVDPLSFLEREMRVIEVVRVHVDERDRCITQRSGHVSCNGALSRACSSSDADDQRLHASVLRGVVQR